jgi:hypothetical protein
MTNVTEINRKDLIALSCTILYEENLIQVKLQLKDKNAEKKQFHKSS